MTKTDPNQGSGTGTDPLQGEQRLGNPEAKSKNGATKRDKLPRSNVELFSVNIVLPQPPALLAEKSAHTEPVSSVQTT
jgi:hypothetical protein